jgi:hypothetical protein
MVWIQNYDPKLDDLYLYSNKPKLFPTYQVGYMVGYNPNNFSTEQTITVDGVEQTISLDFSGLEMSGVIRYGDGGGVYCGSSSVNSNWPRTSMSFLYCAIGSNGGPDPKCGLIISDSQSRNQFLAFMGKSSGIPIYPFDLINPLEDFSTLNPVYWENPNLWHHGSYTGHALFEHEDSNNENNTTEYLITVGHPITTDPCSSDQTFTFLDPETNTQISRKFVCPCAAWDLPIVTDYSCGYNGAGGLINRSACDGIAAPLTNGICRDSSHRLWVLKPGEEPIPKSIKRYKALLGSVRKNNWPIYSIDPQFRVIKSIHTEQGAIFDRNHHSFPIDRNSMPYSISNNIKLEGGEGDDGGWSHFTVTPDGETIWIDHTFQVFPYIFPTTSIEPLPGKCDKLEDTFYIDSTNTVQFNTNCAPVIFHPEEVIPGWPTNDITLKMYNVKTGGQTRRILEINSALKQLGKPQINYYSFPEFTIPIYNDVDLSEIDETLQLKYPLKDSPYLSRESLNDIMMNTNLVGFEEKRMLQASELNELQEKFYKKQSYLTNYIHNWYIKENFTKTNDVLGFSQYFNNTTNIKDGKYVNKIIPTNSRSLEISFKEFNLFEVRIKPDVYFINSNYYLLDPNYLPITVSTNNQYNETNFININEFISGSINTSDIDENTLCALTLNIDLNTILNCNYEILKDNSSNNGSNLTAPCGAKRNLIALASDNYTNQYNINTQTINSNRKLDEATSPILGVGANVANYYVPHILAYAKKENGQTNFYYANGIKI